MKTIKPGYNQEGWFDTVMCVGLGQNNRKEKACGATLEINKADLASRHEHDMGGPREEAVFVCPCGTVTVWGPAFKFTDLPPFKK